MLFPNITANQIIYQMMSITMENFQVFGLGTFTISYNLTNYNFRSGKLVTIFPYRITVENFGTASCIVNQVPACELKKNYPFEISINIEPGTMIYQIQISNVRNPKTTEEFYLIAKLYDSNGRYYDQFTSYQQQANLLYILNPVRHFSYSTSSCQNYADNQLSLSIYSMPFNFSTEGYNEDDYLILNVKNMKTSEILEIICNITSNGELEPDITFDLINWRSLQPLNYECTLITSNRLYQVLMFFI